MFADIAIGVSAAFGGSFHAARVISHSAVQYDDGRSIVPGSDTPILRPFMVQVDSATQAMRGADGYVEGDAAFYVLAATLAGRWTRMRRLTFWRGLTPGCGWCLRSSAILAPPTGWAGGGGANGAHARTHGGPASRFGQSKG
jgi:hypothetical protein